MRLSLLTPVVLLAAAQPARILERDQDRVDGAGLQAGLHGQVQPVALALRLVEQRAEGQDPGRRHP